MLRVQSREELLYADCKAVWHAKIGVEIEKYSLYLAWLKNLSREKRVYMVD